MFCHYFVLRFRFEPVLIVNWEKGAKTPYLLKFFGNLACFWHKCLSVERRAIKSEGNGQGGSENAINHNNFAALPLTVAC